MSAADLPLNAPLSFEQEWLWLLDNAMPGLTAYNVPRALRITGALGVDVLQRALSLIVDRHAALRTTFRTGPNGDPVQVVASASTQTIAIEDLSHLVGEAQAALLRVRLRALSQRPIDLANDSMLIATLLRLNENEHVLSLLTHHIVSDGGSRDILFRELVAAYNAFQCETTPQLPELPVQYAEFATGQRQRLQGAALDDAVNYWRAQLSGAPAALELPTDRPRMGVLAFDGSQHSVALSADFSAELGNVAQNLGMTLNMFMLAAFQSLLHRYTGQEDIVVGCPVSRRDEPVDDLIGFFANVLPFRASFANDPSFRELAARVSEVCMDVYEHAEMPLEPLMRALQRDGRSTQAPLFQAMMVLEYDGAVPSQLGHAKLEIIAHEHEAVANDVALVVRVGVAGLTLALQYRTDLFDSETAERMLGHLRVLLESAVRNPDTLVSRLPLIGNDEHELIITAFNNTEAPYPSGRATHDLIVEQAAKTPENLAIICGSTRMTYRELDERSNGIAARLIELGVKPNSMVGVTADRTADAVVSIIGILKSGACYVPLDPTYPPERIAFIAGDAELEWIVGRVGSLPALRALPGISMISPDDVALFDASKHRVRVAGDSLAYVIYTSGSTGKPKGVLVTHENLVGSTWARVIRYPQIVDRYLMLSSFAFDSSVAGLFWTLIQGGALVVPQEGAHLDVVELCKLMREERVSHTLAIPSFLHEILKEASPVDVEALRVSMIGGDWCSEELLQRHREVAPLASFYNEYGPTETTVWCSVLGVEPEEPLPRITIGRPMPNGRLYVLDARLEVMPIGIPGDIYIGGVGVTPGYLRRPELTNAVFMADPFAPKESPHRMMYKAGERGRWLANGQLDFLGRVDHQVKVNGYRIELGEVESALLREPRVKDAAVLVQGTGTERRLIGYVEVGDGGIREPQVQAELRQFLRRILPEYMVPATIILLEKFALNANGKVDRHALPVPDATTSGLAYVAPADAVEATIAGIMADILNVPQVGAHDDFFALGGSSLVAMRLMARLSRALEVRLTWAMLFEASTVSALGARVRRLLDANGPAARDEQIPAHAGDTAPLSFAQELLWLLDRATPGLNAYNVPMAFRVAGTLDIAALETALTALVARHGPLRTTFNADNSELGVSQRVGAAVRVPVAQVDLSTFSELRREEELAQRVREAIRAPFDITREMLLRATVYKLSDNSSCLLLVSHHIVFDEFSSYVVLRELRALYTEQTSGMPAGLPSLPIRYGDYAAWQRESAERGALVHQLAYWRDRLRDLPVLELPTTGPRTVAPRFDGARRRYDIPEALLDRLRKVSRQHDVTLYMTLLATLKALLHRYSGQTDIVVGAPITTRSREELAGLVGYFPNVLVLRTQLDGDPTFVDLLARVRATCVGGFAHQDVPQEKLALELREAGRSASDPFIQVLCLLESKTSDSHAFGDAELRRMGVDFGTSKFDITVAMRETHDGLGVVLEYRTDLFDAGTMDRLFGHLHVLLDAFASNADRRLSEVPLLTGAEHQQVVYDWNATERAYPANATLNELIEAQAARAPDAPAVTDARESLTYAQLEGRANALAHKLRTLGVTRGQLVGVAAERSVEMVVALLGIIKAGGAYVPVDPEYPADRVAFMLEDSGVHVLLTQARLANSLPGTATTVLLDDAATYAGQPATPPERLHGASDPAYMIYTSGSTGRPKGALNAHSGIVNRLLWMQDEYRLTSADVVLQKTPFSFDVSVWEFFWPLITGARLFMAEPGGHRDTGYLAETIASRGITVCHFVPSMLRAFLATPASAECATLRDVMASGEALAPDLAAAFYATRPNTRLHNLYGPTECAVDVSYWPCPPSQIAPASIPIGRPVANTQLYVLDARLQPVPIGVPGELYLAGRQVGLGYHGRAELTAERFVHDPFSKSIGARMYRTGDRARWRADGNVEYLGRLDFQVKVRGFRIELGEIETTLARHADVQDVAVMAHDDGSGDARLIAYVVPGAEPSELATDEGVDRWREVFDRTYSHAEETGDAVESGFNIAGWISSYDKRPIPAQEMREWVDRTCDRILDLKPRRVLEIGCGTGLLLFRIAPHVGYYHGLDIAATALEGIKADPEFPAISDHVTLTEARADETEGLPAGSFDTIVINSVIQYFPGVDYLVQVLERAVRLVAPGGSIFVGDVRLLPLLETLHTSVALFDAAADMSITDLRALAQQRLWHESELVVDPAFFGALRQQVPRIADVEVLLKRGAASNELSKFRGDVVLHIDRARAPIPGDATPAIRVESLEGIRALLRSEPAVLRLPDLIDARIARDLHARELIALAPSQGTVRGVHANDVQSVGIAPEALATVHPKYDVALLWPQTGTPGRFDAVLRHRDKARGMIAEAAPLVPIARPYSDFVHHAATESYSPEQVGRWRAHLGLTLPDYMIPSAFVRLNTLPLSPSGKVDRKALRPPVIRRPSKEYVAPRTPAESSVVALWAEILRVERVGVDDGFLDLGGHSLLAMRVIGRVRREMGVSVALDSLVRGETAAQFAALIDGARVIAPQATSEEFVLAPVARAAYRRSSAETEKS